jgi:TrmH family RNA methyltransferase
VDLSGIVIVLVRPEGPQNVGSVARLGGNFGTSLRLVDPLCDPTCRDALKMAHPCEETLLQAPRFASLDDALADVALAVATSGKLAGAVDAPPLDVDRARLLLPAPGERLAIVFGNERTGLALDEAARCPRLLRLPTPGPVTSFNLASAVAVTTTMFLAAASSSSSSGSSSSPASSPASSPSSPSSPSSAPTERRAGTADRAALQQAWLEALQAAGFFRTTTMARFTPRLQELLHKMDVSARDVALLRDMFVRLKTPRRAPVPPAAISSVSTDDTSE